MCRPVAVKGSVGIWIAHLVSISQLGCPHPRRPFKTHVQDRSRIVSIISEATHTDMAPIIMCGIPQRGRIQPLVMYKRHAGPPRYGRRSVLLTPRLVLVGASPSQAADVVRGQRQVAPSPIHHVRIGGAGSHILIGVGSHGDGIVSPPHAAHHEEDGGSYGGNDDQGHRDEGPSHLAAVTPEGVGCRGIDDGGVCLCGLGRRRGSDDDGLNAAENSGDRSKRSRR